MNLLNKIVVVCLLAVPVWAAAQTAVTGVVTEDETGFTLSDVSVTNQNTLEETFTNLDGLFSIEANQGDVIVFSLDGYDEMSISYNGESSLNISMRASSTYQLDEVVVIGYGTTTYKDATGSVVAVTEKDFNDGVATAPEQLLTGKVAGLAITNGGGQPGTGSLIRIRGGSSINAVND